MRHQFTKQLTVFVLFMLTASSALSAQAPHAELKLQAALPSYPFPLARELSSVSRHDSNLSELSFKRSLKLNSQGELKLGKHCVLRGLDTYGLENKNLFNQPLTLSPGAKVEKDSHFEMRALSLKNDHIRIELLPKGAPSTRLLLECSSPNIASWTLSDLEVQGEQSFKIHYISTPTRAVSVQTEGPANAPVKLSELKGSILNGLFGSGLPGTAGIQLLLGSNLKAFASEQSAPMMVGHRCKLLSQADQAMGDRYLKGSKFAFRESHVGANGKSVEFVFDNWNHSPHQVRVECKGSEQEVKAISVADLEHDLSGMIQVYQK